MRHVGVLMHTAADEPELQARLAAFLQGLQEVGWEVSRNIRVDTRWSTGDLARLHKDAAELVAHSTGRHSGRCWRDQCGAATGYPHRAGRVRAEHRSGW